MEAIELRISNKVRLNEADLTIKSIEYNPVNFEYFVMVFEDFRQIKVDYLEPIPLTPDLLLKMGFEWRNNSRGFGAIMDRKLHPEGCKHEWKYHQSIALVHEEGNESNAYYTCLAHPTAYQIKYVHQLQNLYFCLTGQELTIKP